jgi:transposase-like protein
MKLSLAHLVSHLSRRLVASHQGADAVAYNPIQFQQGMSLPEFLQCFGTEAACAEAVRRARWPDGFACPRCSGGAHCIVVCGGRALFQCHACHRQTSVTAGTLFGSTKLPLTKWFLAIYLISQAKTGLSALELKRHIGVSYPTAWLIHHKLMTAMTAREAQHRLSGTVQVDDAYLGGERAGGKPGRGSENKVPFVAAVSLNEQGNPVYAKLTPVPGFTSDAISTWARSSLAAGTDVLSDGLGCFAAVTEAGCTHRVEVVGQRKPRDLPQFKWVNTLLGNLKTMLSGAYKAFGYGKYADRYLGAFAYRFNRRFDLAGLVVRLVVDVSRSAAVPERVIRHA